MWSNPKWKALIMELSFIDWSRLDFDQPFKIVCVLLNSNSHGNLANYNHAHRGSDNISLKLIKIITTYKVYEWSWIVVDLPLKLKHATYWAHRI